jgi:hypothetical protein
MTSFNISCDSTVQVFPVLLNKYEQVRFNTRLKDCITTLPGLVSTCILFLVYIRGLPSISVVTLQVFPVLLNKYEQVHLNTP